MTIEEKAKAYDIALDKLKRLLGTGSNCSREDLEYVFPELKESEDERTWIINYLSNRKLNSSIIAEKENLKKAIAWLEKQVEQNYKIIKGKNYFCVKTHNYAGLEWIKGTKYYASDNYTLVNQGCECYCPEYSKEEHNNLFEEVKYDGYVEKQCAQKSTWSEEDEGILRSIMSHLDNVYSRPYVKKELKWLKLLKDRVQPQPKQEWSEEDETILKILNELVDTTPSKDFFGSTKEKCIFWLKSLRPQTTWKPSDEQMEALESATENCAYSEYQDCLKDLREQLKKLREE